MIPGSHRGSPVLLDGAMGTALLARGLPGGLLPEAWVLSHPRQVAEVHAEHVAAGASILLTCTFNLPRLDQACPGLDPGEIARTAVRLARDAGPGTVAGAVGPTGLRAPGSPPVPLEDLRERYVGSFRNLERAGVDLLWAETQLDLREARVALEAGLRTGLQVVTTLFLVPDEDELFLLDGTPGVDALDRLWRDGAAAVGVNCVAPDGALAATISRAARRIPVPLVVKPNAGLPGAPLGPDPFAAGVWLAVQAGASMAGGCCGAGALHLSALASVMGLAVPDQARG